MDQSFAQIEHRGIQVLSGIHHLHHLLHPGEEYHLFKNSRFHLENSRFHPENNRFHLEESRFHLEKLNYQNLTP